MRAKRVRGKGMMLVEACVERVQVLKGGWYKSVGKGLSDEVAVKVQQYGA